MSLIEDKPIEILPIVQELKEIFKKAEYRLMGFDGREDDTLAYTYIEDPKLDVTRSFYIKFLQHPSKCYAVAYLELLPNKNTDILINVWGESYYEKIRALITPIAEKHEDCRIRISLTEKEPRLNRRLYR